MKILLTNPIKIPGGTPTSFGLLQPLPLMYIASYLERDGHKVKILDPIIDHSINKWLSELKKFDPDVVGIGAVSSGIYFAWDTAELVKRHTDAKVIMGGDHVTFLPGETFYCCPYVDFVVRGEGEITTAELLNYLEDKKKINEVKGVSYKKGKKIIHNPPRPWIKNLDELPYPARHLVDMYRYVQMGGRSGLFISSRGCSIGCSFCISSRKLGLVWRPRSAQSVVDEMNYLAVTYPKLDNVFAMDDNFMSDIKRVEKICNLLQKQKFEMPWICQGRADTIIRGGKQLVNKMYRAGCWAIQIGVESPFEHRLKDINKGINKKEAFKAVKLVENAGIIVRAAFIFGFEDETKNEMYKAFEYVKNIGSQGVQLGIITPYPGSPFFEQVKHKLNTHDWRRFTFAHQIMDHDFDLERELNKIFLKYHLRPQSLKTTLKLKFFQFWTLHALIYPMIKSFTGNKSDYFFNFGPTKWMKRDEEYWQEHILKTNLIFEETWYYKKPKTEKITTTCEH